MQKVNVDHGMTPGRIPFKDFQTLEVTILPTAAAHVRFPHVSVMQFYEHAANLYYISGPTSKLHVEAEAGYSTDHLKN